MSRPTRIQFPGANYHIMARGVAQRSTFPDDASRWKFLDLLGDLVEEGELVVHAFCLMSNHYHILVRTPRGTLSRSMKTVNGEYAQWYNKTQGRSGHFWESRFKAILVDDGSYLLECSRYIHLNPIRASLTRPAERWKWSSYRNYVSFLGKPVAPWVSTDAVLDAFHAISEARSYREYTETAKGQEEISPFERATAGIALGGERFVGFVQDIVRGRRPTAEEPALRRLKAVGLANPVDIEREIDEAFSALPPYRRRRLKVYGFWRWTGLNSTQAAARFGLGRSAAYEAVKSVEKRLREDPDLKQKLGAVARRALFPGLGVGQKCTMET